jgi:hypothetical protein
MSDVPADYQDRLNIREQIGRIDRARAESEKLAEETRKFVSEQHKLDAEALKLSRDRGLAPWQAAALTAGGIAALVASLVSLAKSMGWF